MDFLYLDTNAIKNEDARGFFGNVANFNKIASVVRIVVPEMVLTEMKQQKRRKLIGQLDKFKTNYFTSHFGCDITLETKQHIDTKIAELFDAASEEFEFEIAPLDINDKLDLIVQYAKDNRPPFEKGSDKGFKDMLIYLSVIQHYESQEEPKAYVITKDGRLREAFNKDDRFTVLKDVDDFIIQRKTYFEEDYFVGQLNEYFASTDLTAKSVVKADLNIDNNWTLIVKFDNKEIPITVDYMSREIIGEEEE